MTPEPPSRCEKHADEPTMHPCGGCGQARKENADWHAAARRERDAAARDAARGAKGAREAERAEAALVDHAGWKAYCLAIAQGKEVVPMEEPSGVDW